MLAPRSTCLHEGARTQERRCTIWPIVQYRARPWLYDQSLRVACRAEFTDRTDRDNKAMRGRLALPKHFVQNPIEPVPFCQALGVRARPRAVFPLCGYIMTVVYR